MTGHGGVGVAVGVSVSVLVGEGVGLANTTPAHNTEELAWDSGLAGEMRLKSLTLSLVS